MKMREVDDESARIECGCEDALGNMENMESVEEGIVF